jgi:hypothetical protein
MNFELKNVNNKPAYVIDFNGKKEHLFSEQISALLLSYLKTITEQNVIKKKKVVLLQYLLILQVLKEKRLYLQLKWLI